MQGAGVDSFVTTIDFNQDNSYFSLSTTGSFTTFSSCPVRCIASEDKMGGMKIVVQLHHSPLLILVPSGDKPGSSPRRLSFWDCRNKRVVQELAFETTVSSCAMNKDFLAVGTENFICLFSLSSLSLLKKIRTSTSSAVFAMSVEPASYLAYTDHCSTGNDQDNNSRTREGSAVGSVSILDCKQARLVSEFSAHKSAVTNICFSPQADRMATASATGSVVRVFQIPTGECTHFLRHSVPAPLHLFSFLSRAAAATPTAATSSNGSTASQQHTSASAIGGRKVTALSFCPRGHFLLCASASAASSQKDGGFLNVFQIVPDSLVAAATVAAALPVGTAVREVEQKPRVVGYAGRARISGAAVAHEGGGENWEKELAGKEQKEEQKEEEEEEGPFGDYLSIEADDVKPAAEQQRGVQQNTGGDVMDMVEVRYTLGTWQQQLKRAATQQLQSLHVLSQEYLSAAAPSLDMAAGTVRTSTVGSPPVLYARIHSDAAAAEGTVTVGRSAAAVQSAVVSTSVGVCGAAAAAGQGGAHSGESRSSMGNQHQQNQNQDSSSHNSSSQQQQQQWWGGTTSNNSNRSSSREGSAAAAASVSARRHADGDGDSFYAVLSYVPSAGQQEQGVANDVSAAAGAAATADRQQYQEGQSHHHLALTVVTAAGGVLRR